MTSATSIGLALLYEFNSGNTMLVRVSELLGPMGAVVDYMARKNGGIRAIREPRTYAQLNHREQAAVRERLALVDAAKALARTAA